MNEPLCIAMPAWGGPYVELALRHTVPAIVAALDAAGIDDATFLVHTDPARQQEFRHAIGRYRSRFFWPRVRPGRDGHWYAFKQAHKDAIASTPSGGIVALLNSDIVMSRETFIAVRAAFADPQIKTVVSVGIRTAIEKAQSPPPIGATARQLAQWIWANPHHITRECIWDKGRTQHPTILFFEDGNNVAMHCFHLTPMFIRKDRELRFAGTIDDDVLQSYADREVRYLANAEAVFAELSRENKHHPFGRPLTVDGVLDFGKRRFRPSHVRNFRQRMTVLGRPKRNHAAADQIIARLSPPC